MKVKSLFGLLLSLLTLVMFGCGGDGGGGSSTTVKGVAAAGPIVGGTVTLSRINADGTTTPLTTTPTTVTTKSPFGNFSAAVSYSGPLLVQVAGGTYTDEASGLTLTNTGGLVAAVPNATGTVTNISVTPHTTVAAQLAQTAPGATIADKINAANTAVAKALRLPSGFDIINTPVTDANYAFSLAAFSQGAFNSATDKTEAGLAAAAAANVDGLPAQINIATGAVTDATTNQAITQAIRDATANPNIVVPPAVDLTAPAGVSLTAAPTTGIINNSVTITANVSAIGSTSTVPDTTTVTFTTSAGAFTGGTTTVTATTTNGVATATLSGISSAQDVTVSASVGTISSAPLIVPFINDPTAPNGISVAASQASLFVGQGPVTITATVTAAGGANFTVPNGTQVTFFTTAGVLTSPTLTTNGVATVQLDSTAAATASVTARVNGITSTPVVVTFDDPNRPGAITLAANPTSGVTNGQGPVTLSATVSPASTSGTVPTGTVVNFNILTGTGVISAVTTTNASGVATATLNSAVAGTVTVNATAGSAPVVTSNTVSVPFIDQPTLVTVKVATTGTLPAATLIGGVNAIVSANPSTGLTIAPADVTATGASVGSLLTPNTNNVAAVNLALVNTNGIQTGEFATLVYHVAAGTFPTAGDFSVALTGAGIINTLGANIPNIGVAILSVTIQ